MQHYSTWLALLAQSTLLDGNVACPCVVYKRNSARLEGMKVNNRYAGDVPAKTPSLTVVFHKQQRAAKEPL